MSPDTLSTIVAEARAERPLPAAFAELDDRTRAHIEQQAHKANADPADFYAAGRALAALPREEQLRARMRAEVAARSSTGDETADGIVKALRG